MSDETKNTETASNPNQKEGLASILNFLNQPAVASVGLSLFLYWVLDPKGLKTAIENMSKALETLIENSEAQKKEIELLKKKIVPETDLQDENKGQDENLHGYRRARKNYFFLD